MDKSKVCASCGALRPAAMFHRKKSAKDGLVHACKECTSERLAKYYAENRASILAKAKERGPRVGAARSLNKEKRAAYMREYNKSYRAENSHIRASRQSKYRSSKHAATPKWCDEQLVNSIFAFARFLSLATFGEKYHVDHIVPIRSNIVCGLHCPGNLRIITGIENSSKGNRWWPDMFDQEVS